MTDKRAQVSELLRSGVSQAEAARQVGVDKSTVHRWVKAGLLTSAKAGLLAQPDVPAQDPESGATTGLAGLVPKALQLLEEALETGGVSAQKARVALDIVKAAALAGRGSDGGGGGGGELARRIQEIRAGDSD